MHKYNIKKILDYNILKIQSDSDHVKFVKYPE